MTASSGIRPDRCGGGKADRADAGLGKIFYTQSLFYLVQLCLCDGEGKGKFAAPGGERQLDGMRSRRFQHGERLPEPYISVGRIGALVAFVILSANKRVVQIGTDGVGYFCPQVPVIHQPLSQLPVCADLRNELVLADLGRGVQDVIQAGGRSCGQHPEEDLLRGIVHGVDKFSQLVDFLDAGFGVQISKGDVPGKVF